MEIHIRPDHRESVQEILEKVILAGGGGSRVNGTVTYEDSPGFRIQQKRKTRRAPNPTVML